MMGGSPPCIRYNVLNLPDTIQFVAGHQNYYTYDASGKKLELQNITSRNILNLPQDTITRLTSSTKLTTDYCGDAIYQNDTLKEVLTPEGYWQNSVFYYYLKDHQGNTRAVINSSGTVMECSDYYPDGMRFESSTSNSAALPYRYNGKELEAMNGLNQYDYGARRRETSIPVWTTIDPLCEKKPWLSPYAYCSDNPLNRIDPDGGWDVSVHLAKDRSQNGYGIAIVTDRNGNEVYRFQVRAEGTGGRNRMNKNADTPLGTYDIPNKNAWLTGGSRASYGPNARLNMTPESGEIEESGRGDIRIHGGRQEIYDTKTGNWIPVDDPKLKKTNGCLRAFDSDMAAFKNTTDNLQKNDSQEMPGKVTITDDLGKDETPTKEESVNGVNVKYYVPESEVKYWQYLIDSTFGKNQNNGGQ